MVVGVVMATVVDIVCRERAGWEEGMSTSRAGDGVGVLSLALVAVDASCARTKGRTVEVSNGLAAPK